MKLFNKMDTNENVLLLGELAGKLSGQWLERCGFKPGCNYTVSELSGCLLLMVDKNKK